MVNIAMKSAAPLDRQTVHSLSQTRVQGAKTARTIQEINKGAVPPPKQAETPARPPAAAGGTVRPAPVRNQAAAPTAHEQTFDKPIPKLANAVQKGQKFPLAVTGADQLQIRIGWNVRNAACDIDVSAFLLDAAGKVPGDSWFVFYGQTKSPDQSTVFYGNVPPDREMVSIDLAKLNPMIAKIVFVLTINDALKNNLNFSMVKDAYLRILRQPAGAELVSFQMNEYYSNVTSMMIGELYLHNHNWKFNAVGNGVARDLAGLCGLYGVKVQ